MLHFSPVDDCVDPELALHVEGSATSREVTVVLAYSHSWRLQVTRDAIENFFSHACDVGPGVVQPKSINGILDFQLQIRSSARRFHDLLYFIRNICIQITH